ncbi:thioredoxin reductase [Clostridiales bacterium S5-A14a]|nr:thioredoxin reductase [Clostridiales bacterium S5-A14a]
MYDILIVGAGPAGMTAAIYGQRGGKKTIVFDKLSYGGQVINTAEVANYPGMPNMTGLDFAEKTYNQMKDLGAEMNYEEIAEVKDADKPIKTVITTSGKEYQCKAIIIATGSSPRPLGVENEERFKGAGISYCATCDGAFFRDKTVAVCGGGNTALEDAEVLSDIAEKVYLVHRRDEFRADATNVKRVKEKKNVELVLDSVVTAIKGERFIQSLEVQNKKTEEKCELKIDGLFVAIGQMPENGIFKEIVKLNKAGYIEAGEDCLTGTDGIFAAGDCRTKKVRQITTAVSDGAIAALAAIEHINKTEY